MNLDEVIAMLRKRWPDLASQAEDEPVIVLAAGWRSGSTMLQRMLMRHCLVWGEPYGSSALIGRLAQPLQRFTPDWPPDDFFLSSPHWGDRLGDKWTANLYPPIQHLLDAHVAFYHKLFAEPSRQRGFARWGLKEVRYGFEFAVYLQWLFPKAKFLFLVRNPYECFASYRRIGARVLRFWPEASITTPEQFGNQWVYVARGFCERFKEVGGLLIAYEKLTEPGANLTLIEDYVGFAVDRARPEYQGWRLSLASCLQKRWPG